MSNQNIIFIVLDSLRRDRLSVYNSDVDFTDNIESFASDSTVFENAVANAPWTLPSHASIFTGMYPWEHGATQRNLSVDVDKPLLAERLREENYRSAAYSTNAWLSDRFGLTEGFDKVDNMTSSGISGFLTNIRRSMDDWLSKPGQNRLKRWIVKVGNKLFHYIDEESRTEEVLEKSREFIEENDSSFFLFMNLMDAHEPYVPPEKYREKHNAPEPREVCQDPTDYHFGRKQPDFEKLGRIYDASVDYMDDQLGEFFDYLKENDLWEGSVIVLVSDHGQILGENNEYGHQFSVKESLVYVPMMVKGYDEDTGEQVELRELYDITLSAAGIESSYEAGVEFALGGYDFPDMMRPRIPPDKWREFYKQYKFVRTTEGKLISSKTEDGDKEKWFEFGEKMSESRKNSLKNKIEEIKYNQETGESLDNKDEEIKKQLKNLGYG